MDGWLVQMLYINMLFFKIFSVTKKHRDKFRSVDFAFCGTNPASVLCRGLGCFGQFLRHLEMEPSAKGTCGHPHASSSCVFSAFFFFEKNHGDLGTTNSLKLK